LGAVLAGGEGRRFGGPKAEAPVDGVSMVGRAVATLKEAVGEVVVVSSRPVASAGTQIIPDQTPDAGPLGGLEAALLHAAASGYEGVLLLACDLPLVAPDLLTAVGSALGDASAAAPARAEEGEGIEPLCAVYHVDVLPVVQERLDSDDRSLQALFRAVGGRTIPAAELGSGHTEALLNVNTSQDLRRAEAALAGGEDH
jgi:molybdopterin-guanine dinucleotide biosynthesis protein A